MIILERHSINYGDRKIEFTILRKKVKNLNLNIRPDMTISVSACEEVPIDTIKRFVKNKAPWILKNLNYFRDVQPESISKKNYISGETFKYLGKQYRLKVEESVEKESVTYYQGFICLTIRDKSNVKRKEKLINEWYREKAIKNFEDSLKRIYPLVEKYVSSKPEIQIREMKSRWGSCIIEKNKILLNLELIKAPKFCIDYVVLHELIHFRFNKHNTEFYDFMTVLMPDWKQRKAILDEEIIRQV